MVQTDTLNRDTPTVEAETILGGEREGTNAKGCMIGILTMTIHIDFSTSHIAIGRENVPTFGFGNPDRRFCTGPSMGMNGQCITPDCHLLSQSV